jgi:hypothetical protein
VGTEQQKGSEGFDVDDTLKPDRMVGVTSEGSEQTASNPAAEPVPSTWASSCAATSPISTSPPVSS